MLRKSAAVAAGSMLLSIAALALPAAVLGAGTGGTVDTSKITVSAWQAALIAFGYYLANSPWLFGLAFFTLFRPLVAGFLVGCILGDPAQGTLIGAAINVPYLGFISAGGNLPADASFAGWVGTTVALAGHLDPIKAIPIAFGLGLVGTIIFYGRMSVDSIFAHWADARAEKADIGGVALMNWLPGQAFLLAASFIPVFLLALNGPAAVQDVLNRTPLWAVNGLAIAGGLLPAIGIALNMRFIFRGSAIPYFFIGFIVLTVTGGSMSLVVIAALGLCLAYLHLNFVRPAAPAEAESRPEGVEPAASPVSSTGVRVTRGDLVRSWALWTFFAHANYNYERLQGTGFAHAMTPIVRRLYTTPDEIRAALRRHLVFFNTEPNFGNLVHGTVIAMEEQRANGAPIDDDAINSVKSGLMGPLAGIGDTLSQSTITPILLALGIGIAGGTASGSRRAGPLRGDRESTRPDHLHGPCLHRHLGHRLHRLDAGLPSWPVRRHRPAPLRHDRPHPRWRGRPGEHGPRRSRGQVRRRQSRAHHHDLGRPAEPPGGGPGSALPGRPGSGIGGPDLVAAPARQPAAPAGRLPGRVDRGGIPVLRARPVERE